MSPELGVLTTSYPRHPDDAAGRFVAELCGWLAEAGYPSEVLAPWPAASEHPAVQVRALRYALRPQLLYGAGGPDNLGRKAAWAQVPGFVARLALCCRLRARHWTRVISHWLLPAGLVAARCARGLPHLALAHSSEVHLLRRLPMGPLLVQGLVRPRTALVLTSEALRAPLAQLCPTAAALRLVQRAPVVRMGLHLRPSEPARRVRARALRARLALAPDQALALYVGRLVPVKGLAVLLRALARLPRGRLALVLVGDGPLRDELQTQARVLGLDATFLGQLGPGQRDAWLDAADLLVLPSTVLPDGRTDSAPLALLEAMAAGLPVVTTRVGGNAELVAQGDSGLLVPPDDERCLAQALFDLATDPARRRRMGQAGARGAQAYSWDRVGARLLELLLEL